jgi:Fe-S oxidoreductase
VAYHDPCYLGRHNGVYDAPRNLLNILSNSVVELPRNRENSFCCGAGGAQFWKEEEEGIERISDNRYREAEEQLKGADDKVLAVGCPFCKSMLESTPGKGPEALAVRDVAELLLEGCATKCEQEYESPSNSSDFTCSCLRANPTIRQIPSPRSWRPTDS